MPLAQIEHLFGAELYDLTLGNEFTDVRVGVLWHCLTRWAATEVYVSSGSGCLSVIAISWFCSTFGGAILPVTEDRWDCLCEQ